MLKTISGRGCDARRITRKSKDARTDSLFVREHYTYSQQYTHASIQQRNAYGDRITDSHERTGLLYIHPRGHPAATAAATRGRSTRSTFRGVLHCWCTYSFVVVVGGSFRTLLHEPGFAFFALVAKVGKVLALPLSRRPETKQNLLRSRKRCMLMIGDGVWWRCDDIHAITVRITALHTLYEVLYVIGRYLLIEPYHLS